MMCMRFPLARFHFAWHSFSRNYLSHFSFFLLILILSHDFSVSLKISITIILWVNDLDDISLLILWFLKERRPLKMWYGLFYILKTKCWAWKLGSVFKHHSCFFLIFINKCLWSSWCIIICRIDMLCLHYFYSTNWKKPHRMKNQRTSRWILFIMIIPLKSPFPAFDLGKSKLGT